MAKLPLKNAPPCPSAHVWCHLDTARRHQAIAVVAQRAFNVVKTHATSCQQENTHASTTVLDQTPE
jgi:hypothetical protein